MNRKTFTSGMIALVLCACSDSGTQLPKPGDPVLVPRTMLPAESDRVYYEVWCTETDVVPSAKDELQELLTHGIPVKLAWFPQTCSPCECAVCVAVITIELLHRDDAILAFDFIENTDNYVVNCGVPNMWQFDLSR